jgi:hypothetical protein
MVTLEHDRDGIGRPVGLGLDASVKARTQVVRDSGVIQARKHRPPVSPAHQIVPWVSLRPRTPRLRSDPAGYEESLMLGR